MSHLGLWQEREHCSNEHAVRTVGLRIVFSCILGNSFLYTFSFKLAGKECVINLLKTRVEISEWKIRRGHIGIVKKHRKQIQILIFIRLYTCTITNAITIHSVLYRPFWLSAVLSLCSGRLMGCQAVTYSVHTVCINAVHTHASPVCAQTASCIWCRSFSLALSLNQF